MAFAESTAAADRPQNNLLRALRRADFALLAPAIEVVEHPARHLLYNPGDHVGTVYFPCGPSLVSYLVTFPVSALGERLGARPSYDRNIDMAFAIGGCAAIVYLIGAGLGAVAKLLFSSTTPPVT